MFLLIDRLFVLRHFESTYSYVFFFYLWIVISLQNGMKMYFNLIDCKLFPTFIFLIRCSFMIQKRSILQTMIVAIHRFNMDEKIDQFFRSERHDNAKMQQVVLFTSSCFGGSFYSKLIIFGCKFKVRNSSEVFIFQKEHIIS